MRTETFKAEGQKDFLTRLTSTLKEPDDLSGSKKFITSVYGST